MSPTPTVTESKAELDQNAFALAQVQKIVGELSETILRAYRVLM